MLVDCSRFLFLSIGFLEKQLLGSLNVRFRKAPMTRPIALWLEHSFSL